MDQEIDICMNLRNYLAGVVVLGAACGPGDHAPIDAAFVDASISFVDVLPASGGNLSVDSARVVDTLVSEDASLLDVASLEAATEYDAAVAVACNPSVLGPSPPVLLSQTGCFEPGKPGQPIAAFFPYEVNSPLWSDGAVKSRFLLVPPGTIIQVKDCDLSPELCLPVNQGGTPEDEGHFDLPVGAILIKNFVLQDKLIETRLLIRASATLWNGYSYEWNEEASEATLLSDFKNRTVGDQVWRYPSQRDCLQCHTAAAGRSLGPTTSQLDRVTSAGNQLDRLVALGWLATRPKALAPYLDPRRAGPVADRARAYLQSNCSFCHRPAGPFSDMDLRYVTSLLNMKVCNVQTVRGVVDPNVPPVRLVPGEPEVSAISVRMHNRSGYAMPKLGSNLVDPEGMAVVDQWIREISVCPLAPPS